MNRTPFAIVGLVGLGALIGLSVSAGFAEPTTEVRGPAAEKITALRKERRDALLEAHNAAEQMARNEETDYATVKRLRDELLNAELEVASDHAARVAIRKRMVDHLRGIEQLIAVAAEAGTWGGSKINLFEAKADRLRAEIDLALELADDKRSE